VKRRTMRDVLDSIDKKVEDQGLQTKNHAK
jgi:hypothetical protein